MKKSGCADKRSENMEACEKKCLCQKFLDVSDQLYFKIYGKENWKIIQVLMNKRSGHFPLPLSHLLHFCVFLCFCSFRKYCSNKNKCILKIQNIWALGCHRNGQGYFPLGHVARYSYRILMHYMSIYYAFQTISP